MDVQLTHKRRPKVRERRPTTRERNLVRRSAKDWLLGEEQRLRDWELSQEQTYGGTSRDPRR